MGRGVGRGVGTPVDDGKRALRDWSCIEGRKSKGEEFEEGEPPGRSTQADFTGKSSEFVKKRFKARSNNLSKKQQKNMKTIVRNLGQRETQNDLKIAENWWTFHSSEKLLPKGAPYEIDDLSMQKAPFGHSISPENH